MDRIKKYRFFQIPLAALAFLLGLFSSPGDRVGTSDSSEGPSELSYELPDFQELKSFVVNEAFASGVDGGDGGDKGGDGGDGGDKGGDGGGGEIVPDGGGK